MSFPHLSADVVGKTELVNLSRCLCGRRARRHAGQQITVELKFDKATAAWAKDRIWHPSQQTTLLKNGQLLMTLQVADTRDSSAGF